MSYRLTAIVVACAAWGATRMDASQGRVGGEAAGADALAVLPALASVERTSGAGGDATVAFLERRVADDPDDYTAWNRLAARHLERLRAGGDHADLERAEHAVRGSLRALSGWANVGVIGLRARVALANHAFDEAAEHARAWMERDPDEIGARFLLVDALFEGGRYDDARAALRQLETESLRRDEHVLGLAIRRSEFAWLDGLETTAREELEKALEIARLATGDGRETVAWCLWRLGDLAFDVGDYRTAEARQREALSELDGYARAYASLARARAAQGDSRGALELYSRAIESNPHIVYVAAVGDLHRAAGREREAAVWYRWAERIGLGADHDHGTDSATSDHGGAGAAHHARDLALFWADHDLHHEDALRLARLDHSSRRTVESADALAWTAYRAGDLDTAHAAAEAALSHGTRDARILMHAGWIAEARGDAVTARRLLTKALELSPRFDPLLARETRAALESLDDHSPSMRASVGSIASAQSS